jgi:hypothetical protein
MISALRSLRHSRNAGITYCYRNSWRGAFDWESRQGRGVETGTQLVLAGES